MSTFTNFLEFDMKMDKKQGGFTLVEIAIVLVIVGLLLAGVLKGQELIENSRIKSIANEMKSVQAAYNGYIDRYKTVPGDEAVATMDARGWAASTAAGGGNGNGVLLVTPAQTFTNGGEQRAFWRALRASGLFAGDAVGAVGQAGLPRHSGGGLIGIVSDPAGIFGRAGMAVCVSGLSTKQAAGIDTLIDGALPANNIGNTLGDVRAITSAIPITVPTAALPAATAYNETTTTTPWSLCMSI
jgi:prepilin-type N-terminal cleavage/methylation domain-containing protein